MKPKTYGRMTKAEKRVAIAKDALSQLQHKKYRMTTGAYWIIPQPSNKDTDYYNPMFDQAALLALKRPCHVCADGALVLSAIRKFNRISVGETPMDSDVDHHDVLKLWFSKDQINLIENVFEGYYEFYRGRWGKIKTAKKRAIAIFKNIIKNNGTFKP